MSACRNFYKLSEITTGKMVDNLKCVSIAEIVNMYVEVASNDEFMRGGGCVRKNDDNWLRKVEKG